MAAGVAKRRALLSPSISGYQEEMYYTFVRTNRERPYLPHENSDSNAIGAIRDRSRRLRAFLYLTSRGRARPVYYVEAYFGRLHYWAWVIKHGGAGVWGRQRMLLGGECEWLVYVVLKWKLTVILWITLGCEMRCITNKKKEDVNKTLFIFHLKANEISYVFEILL